MILTDLELEAVDVLSRVLWKAKIKAANTTEQRNHLFPRSCQARLPKLKYDYTAKYFGIDELTQYNNSHLEVGE